MKTSKKRLETALFWAYCAVMALLLFVRRGYNLGLPYWEQVKMNINFTPFHSIYGYAFLIIRRTNTYLLKNAIINLFGNIAVFIPYGFFLPRLFERYRAFGRFVLLTLAVLLSVETLQLITLRGSFDVDDIILNLLGAAVGYLAARLLRT